MGEVRLCGVQMVVSDALEQNLPKMLEYIAAAAEDGADIVLFPEMALTGYHGNFDDEALARAIEQLVGAIGAHRIASIIGTGWRENGKTYIQTRAYGEDGALLGTHEKMVPTGGDRKFCEPGEELRTFSFRGITCGMLICNDLWVTPGAGPYPDPRLTYQLGQMGAKIVFHAVNSGTDERFLPYHESNLALRAMESGLFIATANAAHMDKPVNCPSGLMGPDGQWVTKVDRLGEGRYLATVNVG